MKSISITWHVEDVLQEAEKLDVDIDEMEACEILGEMKRKHDANIGINWEIIQLYIEEYSYRRNAQ